MATGADSTGAAVAGGMAAGGCQAPPPREQQASRQAEVRIETLDPGGCLQTLNPVLRTTNVLVPPNLPISLRHRLAPRAAATG